ncbi:hypothetical protein, partial [Methylobacterium variabile]|uniref:hypothetical protein n=1 Tax=Methylobacterium variabile TaxID=298794 RepID=UPI001AE038E8
MRTAPIALALLVTAGAADAAPIPSEFQGTYAATRELCRTYRQNGASALRKSENRYLIVTPNGFTTYWEAAFVLLSQGRNSFELATRGSPATRSAYLMNFAPNRSLRITLVGADGSETFVPCK